MTTVERPPLSSDSNILPAGTDPVGAASAAGASARLLALDRIGVIFVHGIGTQPACATFLDWSGSIVDVLADWRIEHGFGQDPVRHCDYDLSGVRLPIVELDVPEYDGHPAQSWEIGR